MTKPTAGNGPFRSAPRTSSADCSRDWTLRRRPLAQPRLTSYLGPALWTATLLAMLRTFAPVQPGMGQPSFPAPRLPWAVSGVQCILCCLVVEADSSRTCITWKRGVRKSMDLSLPCDICHFAIYSPFASYMEHDELITNKSKH